MLCFCHIQCSRTLLDCGLACALRRQASCCHMPASPAVQVRVGSLSDPDDLPGLAHFLEHMLFYSSEKYPQEDAYSKFVSEHGGSTNAFTSGEHQHQGAPVQDTCPTVSLSI